MKHTKKTRHKVTRLNRARVRLAKKWDRRIRAVKLSRNQFCQIYGFRPEVICRHIKGDKVPRWPAVEKVEAALQTAEGKFRMDMKSQEQRRRLAA